MASPPSLPLLSRANLTAYLASYLGPTDSSVTLAATAQSRHSTFGPDLCNIPHSTPLVSVSSSLFTLQRERAYNFLSPLLFNTSQQCSSLTISPNSLMWLLTSGESDFHLPLQLYVAAAGPIFSN